MSEIRVTSVLGENGSDPVGLSTGFTVGPTSGTTATITHEGQASFTGIVTATSFVPTTGQLSYRNLIINGDMTVAQRGTSSTSQGYQTVDRYKFGYNGHDEALTQMQGSVSSGTTPYTLGFRNTFKVTNGNQTSGAGSSDYVYIDYSFEAQDIANSGWNYNSASSFVTFSFWIKSSVAQSFKGYFITGDGTDYSYAFDTGSLSADTWTKVTKTIPGNSNLTVNNDTGRGLGFSLWPFIGTDLTNNSTSEDAWVTHSGSGRTKDATSTWWTTNDATFELTGLQLEVGPVATPFEHRGFGDEFRRCQRYYQQYTNIMSVGYVPDNTSKSYSHGFHFPVEMRAAPTLTITNTGSSGGQYVNDAETNRNVSSLNAQSSQTSQIEYYFNLTGDLSNFRGAYAVSSTSTTYQTIYRLSAEL